MANAPATTIWIEPSARTPRLKIHGAVDSFEPSVLASREKKL